MLVTARTDGKHVRLLEQRSRQLRTDPSNSGYIELVTCVLRTAIVYLSENDRFHSTEMFLLFPMAKFQEDYFLERKYLTKSYACSTKQFLQSLLSEKAKLSEHHEHLYLR